MVVVVVVAWGGMGFLNPGGPASGLGIYRPIFHQELSKLSVVEDQCFWRNIGRVRLQCLSILDLLVPVARNQVLYF